MTDHVYPTSLSEFADKAIARWVKQKKDLLEPKLRENYNAVTNQDDRVKKWKAGEAEGWRSDTWVGHVRVKVWAFYSVMLDTVLKAGKIPFSLEPSSYQEEERGQEWIADRDKRIERMTEKIEGQLQSRKADREYMKKWLSGGYYGMAFSKFNVEPIISTEFQEVMPDVGNAAQYMDPRELEQYRRFEMVRTEEDTPGHSYVSIWNMVWDMEADNLQEGEGYSEIIRSSAYELRKLSDKPGYIKDAIERVISNKMHEDQGEDGDKPSSSPGKEGIQERKKKYVRFEFHMLAPKKYVEDFEKEMGSGFEPPHIGYIDEDAEESGDDVEIMGEIVDKEIIRLVRNDSGKRPHHMWVVEQNLDESTGTGIADNMIGIQNSLNGFVRAFEDNKKLSANVTAAVKARYFNEPGQLDEVKPGTKLEVADSCDDVRKAIMPIVFPDVGESLMSGIQLMMQLKDDVSMIPTIMQGFNLPKHAPDTAYEMRQLTENAGKYVGQAIRNNDEMFIEPEIWDIYEYNMLYGEDESCKVNCKVHANGFTSFQNKEIRGERMRQALGMFLSNEILGQWVKIKPHLDVIYESMDEDPDKFIKSEEEMEQAAQQREEMQAQEEQKILQMEQAQREQEAQVEAVGRDQQHQQNLESEAQQHEYTLIEDEQQHQADMEQAALEAELDALYGVNQQQVVEQ